MGFATLAAFLIVMTVLCLGERGIRVYLARRNGETGPNRQRPEYPLATAVKLLSRRRSHRYQPAPGLLIFAALLALATVPFGRDLQLLPSSAGVLVTLAALAVAVFAYQLAGETAAEDTHLAALAAAGRSMILTRVFLSALVVSLYLGGWSPGLTLPAGSWWTLLSVVTFVVKTLLVLYGISSVGRFLPEFRPDQAQRLGWTLILPCAVTNVLLTAAGVTLYQLFISGHAQPGTPWPAFRTTLLHGSS